MVEVILAVYGTLLVLFFSGMGSLLYGKFKG
jgi:hypothetical protein